MLVDSDGSVQLVTDGSMEGYRHARRSRDNTAFSEPRLVREDTQACATLHAYSDRQRIRKLLESVSALLTDFKAGFSRFQRFA